jgi:hypothetical protein
VGAPFRYSPDLDRAIVRSRYPVTHAHPVTSRQDLTTGSETAEPERPGLRQTGHDTKSALMALFDDQDFPGVRIEGF